MANITKTTDDDGRRRIELTSPVDLSPLGHIDVATPEEVRAAIERARDAQPAWAALSFDERGAYLMKALEILIRRQDEILDLLVAETGRARLDALSVDVFASCNALAWYAKSAQGILAPRKVRPHGVFRFLKKVRIEYMPMGVVGVISPWNGPLILSLNPSIQALMAGNTVVVKPSEVSPRSGQVVQELFDEAGLPEGVLQVVLGDGETGAALVQGGVDKICFTGSVATGRKVAVACAEQLIPCTLELGGKDAMIICEDADLDSAVVGAVAGSFMNGGQYCSGTERVYVHASIAEDFTGKIVERVKGLKQAAEGLTDVGAMCWQPQLDIVESQVAKAVEEGAKVETGGRRNPDLKGLYYEPTVLTNVTHDMDVMKAETMGPVLPIVAFSDDAEAIRLANDSEFGLGASVWSQDSDRADRIAAALHAGSVSINDMSMTYGVLEVPFGGVKNSGVGVVNGEEGLRAYCHAKPVITDRFSGKYTSGRTYPYTAESLDEQLKAVKFLWGSKLGRLLGR